MLIVKYNITALHTNTIYAKRAKIVDGRLTLTRVDDTLLQVVLAGAGMVTIRPMIQESAYERDYNGGAAGEREDPWAQG